MSSFKATTGRPKAGESLGLNPFPLKSLSPQPPVLSPARARTQTRKIRCDSTILRLTKHQQDTLAQWMSEMRCIDAIERAAKPPEQGGFGVRFHKTTLVRFIKRRRHEQQQFNAALQEYKARNSPSAAAWNSHLPSL